MHYKPNLLLILFLALCILSPIYAMGSTPPAKKQESTVESFAPGTYKTYKNDDLGFSFKYPKDWFIVDIDPSKPSVMSIWLTNFDVNEMPNIPEEKQFEITCVAGEDSRSDPTRSGVSYMIRNHLENSGVKEIGRSEIFAIKGNKIYLIRTIGIGTGKKGKEYELAVTYLSNKKDKYLVVFSPYRIPDGKIYLQILRSTEIY